MRSPSEAPASLVRARPAIAGGSEEADAEARAEGREPGTSSTIVDSDFDTSAPVRRTLRQPEVVFVAVVCALVTLALGVYPEPLFNVARDAGDAIQSLL
jgi:NADH-quinone oxidoreductase subunit N